MDNKALDEALNFLNTGIINLNHTKDFSSSYTKLSHKPINLANDTDFHRFHNDILRTLNGIFKLYKLQCRAFDIYENKSSLRPERLFTVVIAKNKMSDEDYTTAVARAMNGFGTSQLKNSLDKLSNKVKVTKVDYCYTSLYKIYSIDVTYVKAD